MKWIGDIVVALLSLLHDSQQTQMFEKAKEKIKQQLAEYETWNDVFLTFRGKMISTLFISHGMDQ